MPGTERTLVLVKPDGVQRQLIGRILARYEARGLKVVGLKLVRVDRDLAERHYAAHREKPFFAGLVEFIISAPLVALALDGPNAIAVVRAINGATRPHEAAPGTIRGDFALETAQNIVHASDSPEAAADRARAVVRPGRAARLRARRRPVGARPERLGRAASPTCGSPSGPGDGEPDAGTTATATAAARQAARRGTAELARDRDRRDRFRGRRRPTERAGRRRQRQRRQQGRQRRRRERPVRVPRPARPVAQRGHVGRARRGAATRRPVRRPGPAATARSTSSRP